MIGSVSLLIVLYSVTAECKYCWYKNAFGKTTHFYCSAFQYCCGEKCCENMEEFYKLWYFWLCVLILVLSAFIAFYWLRKRYMSSSLFGDSMTDSRERRRRQRRSGRRYRQLTGDSTSSAPPMVIPDTVVTSPPPYQGDNTGCPHSGPPPYILGSGTSINSFTLPSFPPPYSQIEKQPPPLYSSVEEVVCNMEQDCQKQKPPEDELVS